MDEDIYTYFVSGRVYYRPTDESAGFVFPGLCDSVNIAVSQRVINLEDSTQPGGGNYDQIRRIENVTLTLNLREIKPRDLARALYGSNTAVSAGTATDEEHRITKGALIKLTHPGGYTNVSITDDASSPGAIASSNYEVRDGGIYFLEDAADVSDDDIVKVTYNYPAYSRVQALTTSAPELEIFFSGKNEARDDKNVRICMHKVRLGTPQELAALSTDDFGALQVEGELLKDTSITDDALSQYFLEEIVT